MSDWPTGERLRKLASFAAIISGGQMNSPVSTTPLGECNAITKRSSSESRDVVYLVGELSPPAFQHSSIRAFQ
jgi:hypothetical protein